MDNELDEVESPPLPKYFDAEDKGEAWHLHCRECSATWSYKKSNRHPGNLLALLNHAMSHVTVKKGRA